MPRRGRADGYALDLPAVRMAARGSDLVWLCSPNNPTGLPEPAGAIAALLVDLAADAAAGRLPAPVVVLDEAYAEFAGTSHVALRAAYPRLVVVRTASKAYALAGLRVGFGIARRETLAAMEPYRPPGSVSRRVGGRRDRGAARRDVARRERGPHRSRAGAPGGRPARPRLGGGPIGDQLPARRLREPFTRRGPWPTRS